MAQAFLFSRKGLSLKMTLTDVVLKNNSVKSVFGLAMLGACQLSWIYGNDNMVSKINDTEPYEENDMPSSIPW